jgi:adenylate cyclase
MIENNFKIESRGFLFIDLQASMEKVDQLGLLPYSSFINFCFNKLENVRKNFPNIEVHQYAGDGVILTWTQAATTIQAIYCFQQFLVALEAEHSFFDNEYQLFPSFSAAINLGEAVESSLGGFRVFYGNTINSTARLQALCSHYDQNLILGEAVLKACPDLKLVYLNRVYLKGMTTAMEIYGLE